MLIGYVCFFDKDKKTLVRPNEIFFIVLLIAYGCFAGCGSQLELKVYDNIPRSERQGMLVLNFKNTSQKSAAAEYEPWEFGIASMVMTDLETIGLFNVISRERLQDILKEQAFQLTGLVDEKKAVEVGKLMAAEYILSGSFMEFKGLLRIEARVFSVETGSQMAAASVTGKIETFFDLVKTLLFKLLPNFGTVLSDEETIAIAKNIETRSVNASLNNYAGEIALMKSDDMKSKGKAEAADQFKENAKNRFRKALEFDPEYKRARLNLEKLVMAIPMTL